MRKLALRVGRRRLLSAVIALAFCLSTVPGLLATSSSGRTDTTFRDGPTGTGATPVRTLALTVHDPIYINGNAGFTAAIGVSGVSSGTGTASDPYVIADWDINASAAIGISIDGTDLHFVLRNCFVHDGKSDWPIPPSYGGIQLLDCTNGTLENNTSSNNRPGVCLYGSSNNTLSNNNCSSNDAGGIFLAYSSNHNTLTNNTCTSNERGIYLYSSSNDNTLINNNCSNDGNSILLELSSNNTLINNNCSANRFYAIFYSSSNNNTLIGNTCNSNSWDGILLVSSSKNTIAYNLICNNVECGLNIPFYSSVSANNRIWNNTFINNNGAGSTHNPSHVQAYDSGTNNWWNSSGTPHGYGNYWSDWTTPDLVPPYWIVDQPYYIGGNASAKDYYPRTTLSSEPIPEFGMMPFVVIVLLAVIVLAGGTRRNKNP